MSGLGVSAGRRPSQVPGAGSSGLAPAPGGHPLSYLRVDAALRPAGASVLLF